MTFYFRELIYKLVYDLRKDTYATYAPNAS